MNKVFKWLFVLVFVIIVTAAGFTFVVKEGSSVIVSRFGRIVTVHTEAGLYFKLPWPIDNIITFDTRNQYNSTKLSCVEYKRCSEVLYQCW